MTVGRNLVDKERSPGSCKDDKSEMNKFLMIYKRKKSEAQRNRSLGSLIEIIIQ